MPPLGEEDTECVSHKNRQAPLYWEFDDGDTHTLSLFLFSVGASVQSKKKQELGVRVCVYTWVRRTMRGLWAAANRYVSRFSRGPGKEAPAPDEDRTM